MTAAPFRLAAAALAATLLAACGGEPARPQSDFTPVPVTPVLGDVPMGSETATVTLVEYAALTCHACRDFAKQVFPRIKREYIDTGKVKYIYRDFPLEADPTSGKAVDGFGVVLASVARCKGPEKYHDLVDGIFTAQADLLDAARSGKALPILAGVAEQHGMTLDEMRTCIDHQPELNASIKKSRDEAATSKGVNATPTIFLNDERVENRGWEFMKAAIDAKLAGLPIPSADANAPAAVTTPATPPATTETPAPAAPATPPAE
jgi:protein-disulfide isomerase